MTDRRQYGTGSITTRPDGTLVARFEHGYTRSGNRRRPSVTYKPPPGQSEKAALAELKRRVERRKAQINKTGIAVSSRSTIKTYGDGWLERRRDEVRSWSADASLVANWIIPTIGHHRLDTLTPEHVRSVITTARRSGRAESTLVRIDATLKRMLKDATIDGHAVPANALLVKPPSAGESPRDAVATTDAIALLRAASDLPDGSRWAAAFLEGMRQAECLGLRWNAVDLEAGTIDVSWQLKPLKYRHDCGDVERGRYPCGRRFGGDCPQRRLQHKASDEVRQLDGALCLVRPKSRAGKRIIPMVPWMTQALTAWKERAEPSKHGLVWPRSGGRPQIASDDDAAWYALQESAQVAHVDDENQGRRYTIHEARHATASLLTEAGVSEAVIIAIMGHSAIASTRRYQHVNTALARQALEQVAGKLGLIES